MHLLNNALDDINKQKKYLVDGQVVQAKYADKLYEISMQAPDVWRRIKNEELGENQNEIAAQL